MAAAAMTRLLEKTQSTGHLELGDDVLAYQFKRGKQYVLAIWSKSSKQRQITIHTPVKQVQQFDLMGNASTWLVQAGAISLNIDGYPQYVLSDALFQVNP